LELSGIGSREVLEKNGIEVIQELKGVGENLQDHLFTPVPFEITKPITYDKDNINEIKALLQWIISKKVVL